MSMRVWEKVSSNMSWLIIGYCWELSKYEISAKTNDAFSRKWPKTSFFDIFFDLTAVNMQKSPYSLYKSCRQWSIESIYEFSAESSHAFSRKSPKTSKNLIFGHKRAQKFFFGFFGENRALSPFSSYNDTTLSAKAKKSLEQFSRKTWNRPTNQPTTTTIFWLLSSTDVEN